MGGGKEEDKSQMPSKPPGLRGNFIIIQKEVNWPK